MHQENDTGESLWEAYLDVLADPGHLLAELTFVLILDVVLLGLVVPYLRRHLSERLERLHEQLDEEHNVDHDRLDTQPRGPSEAELQRMLDDGVNEWVVQLLREHYGSAAGATEQPSGTV